MEIEELLLFVHVLAAATWFGAAVMSWLLWEFSLGSKDLQWLMRLMEFEDKLAPRLFIPAALLTLASGLGLVATTPWGFSDAWVSAGLALFVVLFVTGLAVFAPAGARARAALDAHGIESEQLRAVLVRVRNVSRIDVPVLALAIFLMTTKPF